MKLFETNGLYVSVTDCGVPLMTAEWLITGKTDIQAVRMISDADTDWKDFVRMAAEKYIESVQHAVDKLRDD